VIGTPEESESNGRNKGEDIISQEENKAHIEYRQSQKK
jgi:hypothetical protein